MNKLFSISYRILRNKYILSTLIFFLWLLVFDRNSLIDRIKYMRDLKEMQKQESYYRQKIEDDSSKLNELRTNSENLEKFAREQYLMKKDNEDIFVIVEE